MANSDGVLVQSVARALEILELFRQRKELGISEISSAMGLSKSTVYGLVNTLVTFGYLEQISENRKYKLGIHLFELGSAVVERLDLRQEARRYCEELSKRYGQTVHLATHWEGEVIYVDKFDMPDFIITYSQAGKRAPMSCTGVGKAMLAFLPMDYIKKYVLSKALPIKTEKTIKNADELLKELEKIRQFGYAIDDEEIEIGLRCVAAPIFNSKGQVVAAISLSGMSTKMTGDVMKAATYDIVNCAKSISARLGCLNINL